MTSAVKKLAPVLAEFSDVASEALSGAQNCLSNFKLSAQRTPAWVASHKKLSLGLGASALVAVAACTTPAGASAALCVGGLAAWGNAIRLILNEKPSGKWWGSGFVSGAVGFMLFAVTMGDSDMIRNSLIKTAANKMETTGQSQVVTHAAGKDFLHWKNGSFTVTMHRTGKTEGCFNSKVDGDPSNMWTRTFCRVPTKTGSTLVEVVPRSTLDLN